MVHATQRGWCESMASLLVIIFKILYQFTAQFVSIYVFNLLVLYYYFSVQLTKINNLVIDVAVYVCQICCGLNNCLNINRKVYFKLERKQVYYTR